MEKEKLYHIALDDYEHGVVIRSLNDEKTKLMEEGLSLIHISITVSLMTLSLRACRITMLCL